MKTKSFVGKSLQIVTAVFTLLIVGGHSGASASEPPENAATCARLSSLVTAADIEKLINRKPVVISPAKPESRVSCTMTITIPKSVTSTADTASITLKLEQHGSPKLALESLQRGIRLAGGSDKIKVLAQDPRGLLTQLNYLFDYAVAGVDATELMVEVIDKSLDGPKVAAALGALIFQRALASDAISEITASLEEIGIHVHFRPMFAMMERCKKNDIPSHAAMLKTLEASRLKTAAAPAITAMSPYAQRWFALYGDEKDVNAQLKRIADAPRDLLAGECEKLTASLPELEKSLPDHVLKALTKAAN
jgi:hypothetical protein